MLAILAFVAFVIAAVLAFTGTGSAADLEGTFAAGLALLALHDAIGKPRQP